MIVKHRVFVQHLDNKEGKINEKYYSIIYNYNQYNLWMGNQGQGSKVKGQVIMITKERNSKIVKAYAQGYSQYTIAKVLGLSQPAMFGVIKRSRE